VLCVVQRFFVSLSRFFFVRGWTVGWVGRLVLVFVGFQILLSCSVRIAMFGMYWRSRDESDATLISWLGGLGLAHYFLINLGARVVNCHAVEHLHSY